MPLQKTHPRNKHRLPNMHKEKLPKLQTRIKETHKIYCTKLREYFKEPINCPEFDEEPIEYKLFKRI